MDLHLRDLHRAACASPSDAALRLRFSNDCVRNGQQVIWRGGADFDLVATDTFVDRYFTPPLQQLDRVHALNRALDLGFSSTEINEARENIPPWPRAEKRFQGRLGSPWRRLKVRV